MDSRPAAASPDDGRTYYEAVLDVRYGMRFNDLCERAYNRADMLLNVVLLVGGGTAAVAVFNSSDKATLASGVLLSLVSAVSLLLGASRKAEQHAQAKRAYAALDARAPGLSLRELDAELRLLQGSSPSGITLLANPAQNAMLRSAGRPELVVPLTRAERLMCAFA